MLASKDRPLASIIIPTYNRAEMLRRTLETIADQRTPLEEIEVIVSDDGSSDDTADVVRSFEGRLKISYHFQEDLGYRAAAARNAGARLATAPLLIFLDTGTLAGPDLVRAHLNAQSAAPGGRGHVVGYVYGYNPWNPCPGLLDVLEECSPEVAVNRLGSQESFRDSRHSILADFEFDLTAMKVPWMHSWSLNFSISADDFWKAGGFDETYRTYGGEDLEFSYRVFLSKVPITFSREAWAIEWPHERDVEANDEENSRNAQIFIEKHRDPVVEIYCSMYPKGVFDPPIEYEYRDLCAWSERARDLDVTAELAEATRDVAGKPVTVAVFGCGGSVPPSWSNPATRYVLADFDATLAARAAADGRHASHHAIGLCTALPDKAADLVIISSRLRGLWDRWGKDLLAEAYRVGKTVRVPFLDDREGA